MDNPYQPDQPPRADLDALPGLTVLDFGTNWCSQCRAARPHIEAALATRPGMRHIKIEDGPGRPLGRSFKVKLWPTVIVLRNGTEVGRVVRPRSPEEVAQLIEGAG